MSASLREMITADNMQKWRSNTGTLKAYKQNRKPPELFGHNSDKIPRIEKASSRTREQNCNIIKKAKRKHW